MQGQIYVLFLIAIITVFMLWQSYRINDLNVEGIIFGVRVPEKYRDDSKVIRVIKEFNKTVTILTLISVTVFLCSFYFIQKVYIIIIYIYILIFISLYACYKANKKLIIVKKDLGWEKQSENKVYVQIVSHKEDGEFNLKLFYIAGAISIVGLFITLSRLSELPKMVPIHFGINGPDNWVDSTTMNGKLQIIMLPVISIVCVWTMVFSAKYQAKKDKSTFNGGTISSLILKKSYSIKSMTQMLGLISLGVSLMIFYGVLLVVGAVQFTNIFNYIFMVVTIGVILFPLTYWMYCAKKVKELKINSDSKEKEIYRDDDKYYIGGMFYYNPNDPSNIVKKRIGYGLDFNYAHALGKIILLLLALLLIGIVLSMNLLSI